MKILAYATIFLLIIGISYAQVNLPKVTPFQQLQQQITNLSSFVNSFFDVFIDFRQFVQNSFVNISTELNNLQNQIDQEISNRIANDTALSSRINALCLGNCTGIFSPVCGSDDNTYINFCAAKCANTAIVPPSAELCDNRDNDCDGSVDESVTQSCYTGSASTRNVGECRDGAQTCTAGVFGACIGQILPVNEICDARDNDCDSSIDESLGATTCGVGECRRTIQNCVNGLTQTCTPGNPTVEVCDNIDNDCDGTTDESCLSLGTACTTDSQCASGNCVDGVCSDTTCSGSCRKANLPGSVGTCTDIRAGQDPDDECAGASTCNGAGACTQ